ncbi:MAG: CAP domain-containing protein, partial [Chloroflexi bacterium]|nr:CAP domain-containing protein [Chloroflexota bacterium]
SVPRRPRLHPPPGRSRARSEVLWQGVIRPDEILRGAGSVVLAAVCVLALMAPSGMASQEESETYCASPAEMRMLELINDLRAGRGLDPLQLSRSLGAAAEHKSQEMASQGYLQHESPDGVTPHELLRAHGYEHNTPIGENIAAGQESAEETFAQWRDSPTHREVMLDEDFEAIGIARAYNVESEYDWYWTAEFGGVLAEPARPCDADMAATPAATPAAPGTNLVRLFCEGAQLPDETYDLTCRPQ